MDEITHFNQLIKDCGGSFVVKDVTTNARGFLHFNSEDNLTFVIRIFPRPFYVDPVKRKTYTKKDMDAFELSISNHPKNAINLYNLYEMLVVKHKIHTSRHQRMFLHKFKSFDQNWVLKDWIVDGLCLLIYNKTTGERKQSNVFSLVNDEYINAIKKTYDSYVNVKTVTYTCSKEFVKLKVVDVLLDGEIPGKLKIPITEGITKEILNSDKFRVVLVSTRIKYKDMTAIFEKCRFKTKGSDWKNCSFSMKFDDSLEIEKLMSMINQRKINLLKGNNEIPVYDMWNKKSVDLSITRWERKEVDEYDLGLMK